MQLPSSLPGRLAALTAALDEPGTDLHAVLAVLVDDLTAAVPSFLGLTMTVDVDGQPITLTAVDPDLTDAAGASMSVPLSQLVGVPAGMVVFYAYNPGAFVDLAADTRRAFDLDGQVVLDGHLDDFGPDGRARSFTGVEEASVIHRAIGVLIARGHPPEQARAELVDRAQRAGHTLPRAAQDVLDTTTGPSQVDGV